MTTREEAIERARAGEVFDWTYVHDKGFRSGERDGFKSERLEDGTVVLWEYGPKGHADGRYPYGTAKRQVWP